MAPKYHGTAARKKPMINLSYIYILSIHRRSFICKLITRGSEEEEEEKKKENNFGLTKTIQSQSHSMEGGALSQSQSQLYLQQLITNNGLFIQRRKQVSIISYFHILNETFSHSLVVITIESRRTSQHARPSTATETNKTKN